MKPQHIVLFFFIIFFSLGCISFFFPKKGIPITKNFTLKFISLNNLINPPKIEYADISEIVKQNPIEDNNPSNLVIKDVIIDTLEYYDTVKFDMESAKKITKKIQFPNNNKTCLYPFFHALATLKNSNDLIRILHYGDSQIEGDRITAYLRKKIQSVFGGSGIGLLPPINIYEYQTSFAQTASKNWKRHSITEKDTTIKHRRYGVLKSFATFEPININDSLIYDAWLKFNTTKYGYQSSKIVTQVKLFLGNINTPLSIELIKDNESVDKKIIAPTYSIQYLTWLFDSPANEFFLRFIGGVNTEVYAIALDNQKGVAVDNIPTRGSAGIELSTIDKEQLQTMFNKLNVKLLILEFGVNIVPNIRESYYYYEKALTNELLTIKKLCPHISIIVIGVSDMSHKVDDHYESYPNIEKIRNAQKNAAIKANCAFWDLYEAMGGKNSMPSWVNSTPALAQKDFTHFTYKGTSVIAEMFYKALIEEYNDFVKIKNEERTQKYTTSTK